MYIYIVFLVNTHYKSNAVYHIGTYPPTNLTNPKCGNFAGWEEDDVFMFVTFTTAEIIFRSPKIIDARAPTKMTAAHQLSSMTGIATSPHESRERFLFCYADCTRKLGGDEVGRP